MGGTKARFDGLDVQAMAALLHATLAGKRVVNVYDGGDASSDTYVFKLESKEFLLLESGVRFHALLHFSAAENPLPSPVAAKLRKHLRGLRLESVSQIGTDRVVLFQFGVGPARHFVILELYAKGNLILTDKDYTIVALLRSHVYEQKAAATPKADEAAARNVQDKVTVQVGSVYPVSYATTVAAAPDKDGQVADSSTHSVVHMLAAEFSAWAVAKLPPAPGSDSKPSRKKEAGRQLTLKSLLLKNDSGVSQYGPALLEHCILTAQLQPHQALKRPPREEEAPLIILSEEQWKRLQQALTEEGPAVMDSLASATDVTPGYILYRKQDEEAAATDWDEHADKIFEEFLPVVLKQHENRPHLTYDNFSIAVDAFFGRLSSQKRLLKAQAAEKAAADRLEKIRADQEARVKALEEQQELLQLHAKTVQLHADNVDKALAVINSALDSGMDWDQLEKVVAVEQTQNQNPIALLIHNLELERDTMVLRLPKDFDTDETVDVRISLKESAHSNANSLFAKYRAAQEKSKKTVEASNKALKAAEETAQRHLAAAQKRTSASATVIRKPSWFEKFHWFITSDNYLVLGGRDAHQNELLVKRYLRPGDAYLHADVFGAASCVLRAKRRRLPSGKTETLPLSEQALREAANFTICRSSAWSSRMVTSAWWVESHQVSKTAPTGEYLTVGSFMIRGKKNFLPPSQLEMGLAVLFRLGDEDSVARHKNERRDFALLELENHAVDDDEEEPELKPKVDVVQLSTAPNGIKKEPVLVEALKEGNGHATVHSSDSERYGPINELSNEEPTGESDEDDTGTPKEKRGLSARDRRMIKKYGSLEAAKKVTEAREEKDISEENDRPSETSMAPSVQTNGPTKHKRGKKAKLKKAAKKYADQDEEDRELAMMVLQGGEKSGKKKGGKRGKGTATATQQKMAEETAALLVKDSAAVAAKLPEEVRSILEECISADKTSDDSGGNVRWTRFDADTLEQLLELSPKEAQIAACKRLLKLKITTTVDNLSASLGGIIRTIRKYGFENLDTEVNERKGPHPKGLYIETSDRKEAVEEETEQEEDAVDDTAELGKLTGKPHSEDLLLSAVPVCGPYQALRQYAYCVKLTPGNTKRGKSSKQCVDIFLKSGGTKTAARSDRQLDLIKKVGDNDWVQVICADVKISAAGASKAVKKQKASAKKSKKK